MRDFNHYYIDGQWVEAGADRRRVDLIDPATEERSGSVAFGTAADVDRAVAAARAAFASWSRVSREDRVLLLERVIEAYKARTEDIAQAVTAEIGAPLWLARQVHASTGLAQLSHTLEALKTFQFETRRGGTLVCREPIGVAALITPWNWPLNQIMAKVAPALAAGCTMVLKPSEIAPRDARIVAEILHEAGVPPGVFNLVHGDGAGVGHALSAHAGVDLVSITGSTRAGVQVAIDAAPSIKRVAQELGGKSANIILDDADLQAAVTKGVASVMLNSGQTCVAPTRMLVPRSMCAAAEEIASRVAAGMVAGDPRQDTSKLGPLSCRTQFERVQHMIDAGLAEGARLLAGGPGRPEGLARGYFVRPTIFADVRNEMRIAREEIFGPVLVMMAYEGDEEAIRIANDSEYGLAGYVWSGNLARARAVARRLRAGSIQINGAGVDYGAPFGGFGRSGNGREFGEYGIAEFLEYKAVSGWA